MDEPSSDQEIAIRGERPTAVLTNADRLRAHLKPESLASMLLEAWLAGEPADAPSRMLKALELYQKPKQATDEWATASED
jgi:hypothetical protein